MARPIADPADRPQRIIRPEIRLYTADADISAYLDQFPARSHPAAIKRAIRAGLTGGNLGLGTVPVAAAPDNDTDFDDFIS
ncbi:MAG: hypothetical protein IPK44_01650 [Candidatus Accumulibacter sp.]|uniref:hypothetical protein n=1 Tax=Accumulibacter sp. TaxID=2053492 RepID=UPI00258D7D44|nr:hypothetical protein [Accumulibacter sp.]MBK8113305.1 hypothetical protein [Accumulibacter sp.]